MVDPGRKKADLPFFTDDQNPKFVPLWMAKNIMKEKHFATHERTNELYVYENGIYKPRGETVVRKEAQERLGRYVKTHYVNETLEAVRRANYTSPDKFNNPNDGIVVENGMLDIKNRELKDHSPEYIHLTKIPWKYDPEKDCPKIKEFIGELVEKGDIKLIQEMFGYCLLRDYPIAKAFMLLGSGANGKSTLLTLLEEFLGTDNIATPSLQQLLDNRFARIDLFGKLANIHADLSSETLENTGVFKMLTGGDRIRGEKKYQDAIEFKNHAKLIYSANELPKTTDRTEAFFRRWLVIDFPHKFSEGDKKTDTDLPYSLIDEDEMSGLLNWSLDGLERVIEQEGFSQTKGRKEIKQKWVMQTDSLRAFLDTCCEVKENAWTTKKDFYDLYQKFCDENNVYTTKKGQVTKRLPSLEPKVRLERVGENNEIGGKGNRPRVWKNIEIKKSFIKGCSHVQEVQGLRTSSIAQASVTNKKSSENSLDLLDSDSTRNKGVTDYGSQPISNKKTQVLECYPEKDPKNLSFIKALACEDVGISEEEFDEIHDNLSRDGEIMESDSGSWKKLN